METGGCLRGGELAKGGEGIIFHHVPLFIMCLDYFILKRKYLEGSASHKKAAGANQRQ